MNLSALALVNFVLLYSTNIALARKLPLSDFDAYSVALSIVTVLGTLATLGLEKYALRCIPVYLERGDWGHLLGFWRFSLVTIIACSIVLMTVLAIALELALSGRAAHSHAAVYTLAGFLPLIAVVLFLVEVATATGTQLQAVVIYRFLLPASFFALVNVADQFEVLDNAVSVTVCYGIGWFISFIAIFNLSRYSMPAEVWKASSSFLVGKWLRRGAPFLINSGMLSVMASSGVIILEILLAPESVVGTYAVAAQTGTFIVLLANTTNRFYLPLISLYLERRDAIAMRSLMRHRLAVIGGLAVVFLSAMIIFGEDILGWFGPDFREGYSALCILSAGATVNAMFSDSPYSLQFIKGERSVFLSTSVSVIMNIVLTVMLGYRFGAIGAACGYTFSMSFLFLTQRILLANQLKQYWLRAS